MIRENNTTEPESSAPNWQPQIIERVIEVHNSNMKPAEVMTDAGSAYLKYMGGCDAGPHPLACEWIGSHLARWFGLPIPDFALLQLNDFTVDLLNDSGVQAQAGAAFISRKLEQATTWDGKKESLEKVKNTAIIPFLVLFDTWTLNWDRCPPAKDRRKNYDNLLIVGDKARKRKSLLVPIDYGQCFAENSEITPRCAIINRVKDERIFGLFEAFRPFMLTELIEQAAQKLRQVDKTKIRRFSEQIPTEWEVEADAQNALIELICSRAAYLADNGPELLKFSNNELF